MPKTAISTIKSWFQTGDRPTQSQFWDWIDSFFHKDDAIPMAQVTGLDAALAAKATQASVDALRAIILNTSSASASQSIPAGTVVGKIRIKSTSALTFSLGTTVGGGHILSGEVLSAGQVGIYQIDFDCEVLTTIHFSGLAGNTSIKIFLLQ